MQVKLMTILFINCWVQSEIFSSIVKPDRDVRQMLRSIYIFELQI
jgi:hypothetical protein